MYRIVYFAPAVAVIVAIYSMWQHIANSQLFAVLSR